MTDPRPFLPPPPGQPESELQRVAREVLTDLGYVWLGDLAGMEVVPVLRDHPGGAPLQLRLTHRCGHEGVLLANTGMDGISDDHAIMLANLVQFAAEWRRGHACPPHKRSPETEAMVQRWQDTEVACIPVRRCVDGHWGTVMVTFSDWAANEGAYTRRPPFTVEGNDPC